MGANAKLTHQNIADIFATCSLMSYGQQRVVCNSAGCCCPPIFMNVTCSLGLSEYVGDDASLSSNALSFQYTESSTGVSVEQDLHVIKCKVFQPFLIFL